MTSQHKCDLESVGVREIPLSHTHSDQPRSSMFSIRVLKKLRGYHFATCTRSVLTSGVLDQGCGVAAMRFSIGGDFGGAEEMADSSKFGKLRMNFLPTGCEAHSLWPTSQLLQSTSSARLRETWQVEVSKMKVGGLRRTTDRSNESSDYAHIN